MATAKFAEQAMAVWIKYLASPAVVITAWKAAKVTETLGRLMAVTGPETGLGAASAMGPGAWCLVAAAGVGVVLVYVAYRTGQILFRLDAISENGCGGGGQGLLIAAREEFREPENQQLRDQLETFKAALTTAKNTATSLQDQLDAEKRTVQRIEAERDQLKNRLLTVENDNRMLRDELAQQRRVQEDTRVANEKRFARLEQMISLQRQPPV